MKQAFLIVAHKNFEQTKQLIEFIADEDHHVYIHIDQKNDGLFNQLKQYFQSFNTVFFLEQRMSINWGGLSQVLVTIQLLKQASNRGYDFYHLISGQDLFIKTKKEVSSFLKKNKGRQFLETLDIEENLWRIKGYYLFSDSIKYDCYTESFRKEIGIINRKLAEVSDIVVECSYGNIIYHKDRAR